MGRTPQIIRVPVTKGPQRGRPAREGGPRVSLSFQVDVRVAAAFRRLRTELAETDRSVLLADLYRTAFEEYLARAKVDWKTED